MKGTGRNFTKLLTVFLTVGLALPHNAYAEGASNDLSENATDSIVETVEETSQSSEVILDDSSVPVETPVVEETPIVEETPEPMVMQEPVPEAPVVEAVEEPIVEETTVSVDETIPESTAVPTEEPVESPENQPEESAKPLVEEAPMVQAVNTFTEDDRDTDNDEEATVSDEVYPTTTLIEMPAMSFDGSAGIVTVHAEVGENVFPKGTIMSVTSVSAEQAKQSAEQVVGEDEEVVDIAAVDITFYYEGNEIQPSDAGQVAVRLSVGRNLEGTSHEVVHIDDKGSATTLGSAEASSAGFVAESFSIYAIVGISNPALRTYEFYSDGVLVDTQRVKNGEALIAPASPTKENAYFEGWFVGDTPVTFATAISVSETGTVRVDAKFTEASYVFYHDDQGRVISTHAGKAGDVYTVEDVTFALSSTQSVTGWYTEPALENKVETVTLGEAINLYPKVEEGHFLYFDTGTDADYIAPQFVAVTKTTVRPNNPDRYGFTFVKWVDDGGREFTFGKTIDDNVTVHATWKGSETTYRVIIWKQSVSDAKDATVKTYDFESASVRTAIAGTTVSPSNQDLGKNYLGFTLNAKSKQSAVVDGRGTTVLNVYYDRVLMTINFNDGGSVTKYTGLYGQTLAQNKYTWPSEKNYVWKDYSGYNTLTFLDSFLFDSLDEYSPSYTGNTISAITVYKKYKSGSATVTHYKENPDGSYTKANSTNTAGGNFYFSNKYEGFTVSQYRTKSKNSWSSWANAYVGGSTSYSDGLEIRYKRNSYTVTLQNVTEIAGTRQFKYEASLASLAGTTVNRPSSIPEDYVFTGWYKDSEFTVPFDFSIKMPANNLVIYAGWKAPVVTNRIYLNMEGTDGFTREIPYGEALDPATMPTVKDAEGNTLVTGDSSRTVIVPEGYEWVGWAQKVDDSFIAWNFATKVYSDLSLYPYYRNTGKLHVTYDANGGTDEPIDSRDYAQGAYARVLNASSAPEGKVFLSWNTEASGNGASYQPGSRICVTQSLTLFAIYGDLPPVLTLTYFANNGTDASSVINNLHNNEPLTVRSFADNGFEAPQYKEFVNWNTRADGSGTAFTAGQNVGIDQIDTNELYAQYRTKKENYTVERVLVSEDGSTSVLSSESRSADLGTTVSVNETDKILAGYKYLGDDDANNILSAQLSGTGLVLRTCFMSKRNVKVIYKNVFTMETIRTENLTDAGFVQDTITIVELPEILSSNYQGMAVLDGVSGYPTNQLNYQIVAGKNSVVVWLVPKISVTVKPNGLNAVYDGTKKSVTQFNTTVTFGTMPKNHVVKADFIDNTAIEPGMYHPGVTNVKVLDENNADITAVYTITTETSDLVIAKAGLTIESKDETKVFDGTPLIGSVYEVTGLIGTDRVTVTMSGKQEIIGSSPNTFTYAFESETVANRYEVTTKIGTLELTSRDDEDKYPLVLGDKSLTRKYDGNVHTLTGFEEFDHVVNENLTVHVSGITLNASGKDVGEYTAETAGTLVIKDAGGNDITDQFKVTIKPVTVTITKRYVGLESTGNEKIYDGLPLKNTEVRITDDGFAPGEGATIIATGEITKPGTAVASCTYVLNENTKAENYQIVTSDKSLIVKRAPLTIESKDQQKIFDGTPLVGSEYEVKGLVNNETVTVTMTASQTLVGGCPNTFTYVFDQPDNRTNYAITTKEGTLTVIGRPDDQKFPLVLGGITESVLYDGTEHVLSGFSEFDHKVNDDLTVHVSGIKLDAKGKDAGTYTAAMEGTLKITDLNGNDITNQFNVDIGPVKLTVNKRNVTLTSGSKTKEYDSIVCYNYTVAVSGDGFAPGEGARYEYLTDCRVVDEWDNTFAVYPLDGTKLENYNITKVYGKLAITPAPLTITSKDQSKVYDGTPLIGTEYEVQGLFKGDELIVTMTGRQDFIGTSKNTFNYTLGLLIGDCYKVTSTFGTLEIKSRDDEDKYPLVLGGASETVTYDGKVHTVTGFEEFDRVVNENLTVHVSGITLDASGKDAGNYVAEMGGTLVIKDQSGRDITDQFNVTMNPVTLKIEKRKLSFATADGTKIYDGKPLLETDVTVGGDGFVDGESATYNFTANLIEPGSAANTIELIAQNGTKLENYDITILPGKLTVEKASLVIRSLDQEKIFDGLPLVGSLYEVEGLVNDETVTVTMTGIQKTVGSSPNSFEYAFDNPTDASHYDIKVNTGKLTVYGRPDEQKYSLEIGGITDSVLYDGHEHELRASTEFELEVTVNSPSHMRQSALRKATNPTTFKVYVSGIELVAKGTDAGVYEAVPLGDLRIEDEEGNDITDQFNLQVNPVVLTITKRQVTLTSADDEKIHDGLPLVNTYVKIGGHGFAEGEGATFEVTGSQTEPGTSKNTFTHTLNENTKEENYDIERIHGTLTVHKKDEPTPRPTPTPTSKPEPPKARPAVPNTADEFSMMWNLLMTCSLIAAAGMLLAMKIRQRS